MIRKGDIGAVYGIRYKSEYYLAKVVTYINEKSFQAFLDFSNKIPHSLHLLNILAYAKSVNKNGAINLYLITEIKRSNLENSMSQGEIIRLEQKIKIID